jgi:hypothetical protein
MIEKFQLSEAVLGLNNSFNEQHDESYDSDSLICMIYISVHSLGSGIKTNLLFTGAHGLLEWSRLASVSSAL